MVPYIFFCYPCKPMVEAWLSHYLESASVLKSGCLYSVFVKNPYILKGIYLEFSFPFYCVQILPQSARNAPTSISHCCRSSWMLFNKLSYMPELRGTRRLNISKVGGGSVGYMFCVMAFITYPSQCTILFWQREVSPPLEYNDHCCWL